MKEKDLTREMLVRVAEDLNKLFETPIETGEDATKINLLKKDLIEAGAELLKDDVISDESKDVLIALGVKLPWEVEEVNPKTDNPEPKKADKKAKIKPIGKKKSASKKQRTGKKAETKPVKEKPIEKEIKEKAGKYTRAQAFCDALQGEPKTIEEIAKIAIFLYEEKTGKTGTQIKTAIWNVTLSLQPLLILGFVEKADKKYSLK